MIVGETGSRRAGDLGFLVDAAAGGLDEAVRRASGAFRSLEDRLAEVGGIAPVVALYDRIRGEMDRLEYAELDRVAAEIRGAIDALLCMDAAVRKLNNLKVMFEGERARGGPSDGK
jgi:hypothetical protein